MKEGDKVTWVSQAQGVDKIKTGTVIAIVPSKFPAKTLLPDGVKKSHIKFDVDRGTNERVLVAVPAGKSGNITHYYCPTMAVLINQGNR